jgi:hypothetical protein
LYKTDHFLRPPCVLHFDASVAVGSLDCTGRLENEQQSIPTAQLLRKRIIDFSQA